ncbi:MAG: ANTAR domain-containing protein [Acidimicrobiales bacterium]
MTDSESQAARRSDVDDLSARISGTARSLFSAGAPRATLERLVALATGSIDGCDYAGAFVVEGDHVTAPASTGPVAAELGALQQQLGEGPCLDAIAEGGVVYAGDLADTPAWEVWASAAVAVGVRSVFALAMGTDGHRGALNCYSQFPQAFGAVDRGKAFVLATLAGLALSAAEGKEESDAKAHDLEAALVTREVIGPAQGILMERERITADQAFDLLRLASRRLNVKPRDVAQRLVDTGENLPPS